jgi:hypothetical protein
MVLVCVPAVAPAIVIAAPRPVFAVRVVFKAVLARMERCRVQQAVPWTSTLLITPSTLSLRIVNCGGALCRRL